MARGICKRYYSKVPTSPRLWGKGGSSSRMWDFPKIGGVPYFGVLIIRILPLRILGSPIFGDPMLGGERERSEE